MSKDKITLQERIEGLPEFPVETFKTIGVLDYSERMPVVTLRPHKFQTKPKSPPSTPIFAQNKSSVWSRKYWVQVIYPRVICQSPWDTLQNKEVEIARLFPNEPNTKESSCPKGNEFVVEAMKERFYKLSTINGKRFPFPWWCSVKGGPWLAIAQEDESCTDGVPNRWSLQIIEMPEVSLVWDGHFEDMPSYPSLTVIGGTLVMFDQSVSCCGGYSWCPTTQSCIPIQTKCQSNTPA